MSVLKVHYFLWFGSLSGIMPFVSIFAKEHSIATAEDVGLLFFVLPFLVSVIKPLVCSIADRNNSHRKVLIVSIVVTILGYGLLLTIIFIKIQRISWYWFCSLIFVANSSYGVVISINDYLVMKEVTELNKTFGSYRVWGTIGWGGFGVIAGVFNEFIHQIPYLLPGLLMFIFIELIDLVIIIFNLKKLDIGSENNSVIDQNMIQTKKPFSEILKKPFISTKKSMNQIFQIFWNNPSLLQYVVVVLMFGTLTAFHWSYYFWYLEIIRGQKQLLFGLTLFVQSFLGELPIFLVADRILRYCGPAMTLNISLLAFALRYFIYGYVLEVGTSYWDVLIVEIVQGLTFSLFYTTMANLAQHYANQEKHRSLAIVKSSKTEDQFDSPDIEFQSVSPSPQQNSYATLQGIMSGAFEGVGLGMGALIGGYVIERVSVFYIWKVGAIIALATIVFNTTIEVIKYFYKRNSIQ